jgi:hypothetical protein
MRCKYPPEYQQRNVKELAPLYQTWGDMRRRCMPNHRAAHRYHDRGISVTEEWLWWPTFADWALSNGWAKGLEIDRIDNDSGYRPDNCRFVTREENNLNKDFEHVSRKSREARIKQTGRLFECVETGEVFVTMLDAQRKTGIRCNTIGFALSGRFRHAGGLHWKYIDFHTPNTLER